MINKKEDKFLRERKKVDRLYLENTITGEAADELIEQLLYAHLTESNEEFRVLCNTINGLKRRLQNRKKKQLEAFMESTGNERNFSEDLGRIVTMVMAYLPDETSLGEFLEEESSNLRGFTVNDYIIKNVRVSRNFHNKEEKYHAIIFFSKEGDKNEYGLSFNVADPSLMFSKNNRDNIRYYKPYLYKDNVDNPARHSEGRSPEEIDALREELKSVIARVLKIDF